MVAPVVNAQHRSHSDDHHGSHRSPSAIRSPYADEREREIKALSVQEQRAWLEGQGSGLARAAELNAHPGPMHVLELAAQLRLSDEQERLTRALMDRHKAEVRGLGWELVELEIKLDRLFKEGSPVNAAEASRLSVAIGTLAGRIRSSHLQTHIEQTALLTRDQVRLYQVLRGYAE
jgi:hypothetical protein